MYAFWRWVCRAIAALGKGDAPRRQRPTTATPHDGNAPRRQRRQKFSGQVPENRRNWELEPMVPNFVDRTGGSKWPSALPTGKPETLAAFPCMVECIEIPAILLGLRGRRRVQAQPAGSKWLSALPTGKPETLAAFPCMVECIEIPAILLGLRGSRWVQAQPARLLSRLTATAPLSWEPSTLQNHVSPERGGGREAGGGV